MSGETIVPVCHIQHDFEECLSEETDGGQFYINVDKSLNEVEEITVKFTANAAYFDAGNGRSFSKIQEHLYEAVLGELSDGDHSTGEGVRCQFQTMDKNYTVNPLPDDEDEVQWTALDTVGIPNELFALGNVKGDIRVYDEELSLKREMKGAHLGDITSLRFFPSGEVLLSSSADMQVKIWSVIDGSNPRTFAQHKAAVTDLCLIERGRNFLSSSADGTIRLWECGSGQNLNTFIRKENPSDGVNSIELFSDGKAGQSPHRLEFGTQGKHVVAGHCSGVITVHGVYSKEQETQLPNSFTSSCNAVVTDPENEHLLYAGYDNGALAQWDLRNSVKPVDHIYINKGSPINSLHICSDGLYVSSGLDSSLKLNLTHKQHSAAERTIEAHNPTFLVSEDYRVAQYASTPDNEHVVAVGNWGFCGKYRLNSFKA